MAKDPRYSDLGRYIDLMRKGAPGWKTKFDQEMFDDFNAESYAYLAGRYSSLLDDLIRIIGEETACYLVDAHNELSDALNDVREKVLNETISKGGG